MSQHAEAQEQQQKESRGKVVFAKQFTRIREIIDGKTGEVIKTTVEEPKQK